ncbi:MAG: S-methyl-5-thioribose kinase [Alphaproteobacteria bacterium]|nr:S-methyl-5-thioribose kinase [Alphaproteobacteria bacterium]
MTAQLKTISSASYRALTPETVGVYLAEQPGIAAKLGGNAAQWRAREVGDGNLNLVFIVEGAAEAVVVKQALPYVRLVGESWPLPLSRAHFEHLALQEQSQWAAAYVPKIYAHDDVMALTVMEYLAPHIILRKGLVRGNEYPHMAEHLGKFLAQMLFHTSNLYLPAAVKKEKVAAYLANTAMCKISEDLIFDEPYFNAPMNRHTSPYLDSVAQSFKGDTELKRAVQEMKWRFLNHAEALLHGDLHTGSVMVTETDTRSIDPEFAFYGPMGFDVGAILANLWMAFFAQPGHASAGDDRNAYATWILLQSETVWRVFAQEFTRLALERNANHPGGDVVHHRLSADCAALKLKALEDRLGTIWQDSLGFAACKIIRRILGLAHIEDFEAIEDLALRATCEQRALTFARDVLLHRERYADMSMVIKAIA